METKPQKPSPYKTKSRDLCQSHMQKDPQTLLFGTKDFNSDELSVKITNEQRVFISEPSV